MPSDFPARQRHSIRRSLGLRRLQTPFCATAPRRRGLAGHCPGDELRRGLGLFFCGNYRWAPPPCRLFAPSFFFREQYLEDSQNPQPPLFPVGGNRASSHLFPPLPPFPL